MNQRLKLQLAGYVDDGMDYSNSFEVRNIVDSSDMAREFYDSLLFANQRLKNFFQSKDIYKTNKKLHAFIETNPKQPAHCTNLVCSMPHIASCRRYRRRQTAKHSLYCCWGALFQ